MRRRLLIVLAVLAVAFVVTGVRRETAGILQNRSGLCGPVYDDAGAQVDDYGPCPTTAPAIECEEWRWAPFWEPTRVPPCAETLLRENRDLAEPTDAPSASP